MANYVFYSPQEQTNIQDDETAILAYCSSLSHQQPPKLRGFIAYCWDSLLIYFGAIKISAMIFATKYQHLPCPAEQYAFVSISRCINQSSEHPL